MTQKRRLTPKKLVLAKHPRAACYRDKFGRYVIVDARLIGGGDKERDAWADAARKL